MVAYWSQTGNTAAMAAAVAQGIEAGGKEAVVAEISSVSMEDLKAANAFAMGCPAMGAEVVGREGVICQGMPDDEGMAACVELGKALAAV